MLRGAVLVVLLVALGVVVVFSRSMRQAHRLLAAERAELASSYGALAAERSLEHTAMLEQFAALLRDQADEIESLRGRAADSAAALPGVAVLFGENSDAASSGQKSPTADEADEMWPDLAEAPTVVDLMAWDAAAFRRADLRRQA